MTSLTIMTIVEPESCSITVSYIQSSLFVLERTMKDNAIMKSSGEIM